MKAQLEPSELTPAESAAARRTEENIAQLRDESRARSTAATKLSKQLQDRRQKNLLNSYLSELSK
ncbi:hypothetical protein [Arthrobacter sp.]|uniref:hypothetical protein n=1 Tax=Arthrobacter sp. TaxID=1667 RepID=UPI003A8F5DB2